MKQVIPLIIITFLVIHSCVPQSSNYNGLPLPDNKYDTHFPVRDATPVLNDLVRSVKKLHSSVFYRSFTLRRDNMITAQNLNRDQIEKIAIGDTIFNQSVIGSATIFLSEPNQVAMLTCAHVVDFPDTIVHFFPETEDTPADSLVRVIAYKIRQDNYLTGFPKDANLDILAIDSKLDIAIVGASFPNLPDESYTPFPFPAGNTKELNWGHVVYLAGYPLGHQMLTGGIVSRLTYTTRRSFLIDASFNQGMSGAPVVAIRDGTPNFEIVGLANAVAAESRYVLAPEQNGTDSEFDYIKNVPYEGKIFTRRTEQIRYGVTFVIAIEDIIQFVNAHRESLAAKGYDFSGIFPQNREH